MRRSRGQARPARAARGFSLIELMVALALGLLVLAAVFVSATGMVVASRQQRAASAMSDDALLALSLIRRDLLMAAYVHPLSISGDQFAADNALVTTRPVFGCSHGFADPAVGVGLGLCRPAAGLRRDAIEINFEASRESVDRASDDRLTDCQGTRLEDGAGALAAVATADSRLASVHRYFVPVAATGRAPELACASAVSPPQPLVPQVEALRIRYGVSSGWDVAQPASRRPVRYVDAEQVLNWAEVVAVHLCVLMRSESPVLDGREVDTHGYADCDGVHQTSTDNQLRRAYATTVALRNRVAP